MPRSRRTGHTPESRVKMLLQTVVATKRSIENAINRMLILPPLPTKIRTYKRLQCSQEGFGRSFASFPRIVELEVISDKVVGYANKGLRHGFSRKPGLAA